MTRLVVAVALLTASVVQSASPKVQPTDPAVDRGQRLFTTYGCYQCHGREGQGAPSTGPRLGPNPVALAAFVAYVRAPTAEMPPYTAKVIGDAELSDIRAFLAARPVAVKIELP